MNSATTQPTISIDRGTASLTVAVSGRYTNYVGEDTERFGNGFDDITAEIVEIEGNDSPHTFAVGDEIELTHQENIRAEAELMDAKDRNAGEDY